MRLALVAAAVLWVSGCGGTPPPQVPRADRVSPESAAGPAASEEPALQRRVSEIYVTSGDALECLPELVSQLEVSAGVDLGVLPERDYSKYKWPDQAYLGVPPWPAPRQVEAVALAQGTVRQALEACTRANPAVAWAWEDGVLRLSLRRDGAGQEKIAKILAWKFDECHFEGAPLAEVVSHLNDPAAEAKFKGKDWFFFGVHCGGRAAQEFPPRRDVDPLVWLDCPGATLSAILDQMARQVPPMLWLAYDQKVVGGGDVSDPWRSGTVLLSPLSNSRRRLDLATLVHCLDRNYRPLHGYADVNVRIADAKRELARRHHFHPQEVRDALLADEGGVPAWKKAATGIEVLFTLTWIFSLHDSALSLRVMDGALAFPDADSRWSAVVVFLNPCDPEFKTLYLPVWQRLTSDTDPRIRKEAERILDWQKKREALLHAPAK